MTGRRTPLSFSQKFTPARVVSHYHTIPPFLSCRTLSFFQGLYNRIPNRFPLLQLGRPSVLIGPVATIDPRRTTVVVDNVDIKFARVHKQLLLVDNDNLVSQAVLFLQQKVLETLVVAPVKSAAAKGNVNLEFSFVGGGNGVTLVTMLRLVLRDLRTLALTGSHDRMRQYYALY
jgi:hypothetical protein